MANITIKIDVKDNLEAFKLVNKLSYDHGITEVDYKDKLRKYDKTKPIRWFLKEALKKAKLENPKVKKLIKDKIKDEQ